MQRRPEEEMAAAPPPRAAALAAHPLPPPAHRACCALRANAHCSHRSRTPAHILPASLKAQQVSTKSSDVKPAKQMQ